MCYLSERWLRQLHKDLKRSQRSAFAKGTVKNFKSQWNKFLTFCERSGNHCLPVSSERLCLYIQFLTRSLKSPKSVRNYVHGLKTLHNMLDFPFPPLSSLDVKLTFRGIERRIQHVPSRAVPVTPALLLDIVKYLDLSDPYDATTWCLFLFLFFLFSRRSQFVPDNVKDLAKSHMVLRSDIQLLGGLIHVSFRWTKTLQFGGRVLVIPLVPVPGSPLCPVSAYARMLKLLPAPPSSLAFVFPSGKSFAPISYWSFQSLFRRLVGLTGRDPAGYSTHSFRRGGASFAYSVGVRGELIQAQGDWASDAYKVYLEMAFPQRVQVARAMALGLL